MARATPGVDSAAWRSEPVSTPEPSKLSAPYGTIHSSPLDFSIIETIILLVPA